MSALAAVTLNRVAVTMPAAHGEAVAHCDESSKIVCEIAERLEELNGFKVGLAADLVINLACIATNSRRAFEITVQLLHANYDDVLASYQDQADRRGVTKQDIHWEFQQEVGKLRRLYPTLYSVIMATRAQALAHEDPISKAETVGRAGGAGDHSDV